MSSLRLFEWSSPIIAMMPSFFLSLLATTAGYAAAGPTLGLFIGTFLLATVIVPPLQMGETTLRAVWRIVTGVCAGAAIVWIASATRPNVYLWDCVRCMAVFAAYLVALAGVEAILRRMGMGNVLACALTVVLGLAWLTWPVWLSAALEGRFGQEIVSALVPAHPLFSVNSVLKHFGAWDHYPRLAYPTLTVLNQDVSYNLPRSILPAVLLHAGIGGALLTTAFSTTRKSPSGAPTVEAAEHSTL